MDQGEVSRGRSNPLVRRCAILRATHVGEANRLARADEGLNLFLQATVWNDSMDVKRQQGSYYQTLLFTEQAEELRPAQLATAGPKLVGAWSHKRLRRRAKHAPCRTD